jgi:hypothetical protein
LKQFQLKKQKSPFKDGESRNKHDRKIVYYFLIILQVVLKVKSGDLAGAASE